MESIIQQIWIKIDASEEYNTEDCKNAREISIQNQKTIPGIVASFNILRHIYNTEAKSSFQMVRFLLDACQLCSH